MKFIKKLRFPKKKLLGYLKENKILIIIFIIAVLLRAKILFAPCLCDHQGWGCRYYGNIAQNYVNYGFLATKFGAVTNRGITNYSNWIYGLHHPSQLFYILIGTSLWVFGYAPWSIKLVPFLFSLLNLFLIYKITKRVWNKRSALIASFFFALAPAAAFYGSHADIQGSVPMFFILLMFSLYLNWQDNPSTKNYSILILCFFIGSLTDWPVYLSLPTITLHHLLTAEKKKKEMILLPLWGIVTFLLYFLYASLLVGHFTGFGSSGDSLLNAWTNRRSNMANDSGDGTTFSTKDWIIRSIEHMNYLFTPILIILSLIWFISLFLKSYTKKDFKKDFIIISLGLIGIIYVLLFPQGAWVHIYWFVYILPALVMASSQTLEWMIIKTGKRASLILLVLVFLSFFILSVYTYLRMYYSSLCLRDYLPAITTLIKKYLIFS